MIPIICDVKVELKSALPAPRSIAAPGAQSRVLWILLSVVGAILLLLAIEIYIAFIPYDGHTAIDNCRAGLKSEFPGTEEHEILRKSCDTLQAEYISRNRHVPDHTSQPLP